MSVGFKEGTLRTLLDDLKVICLANFSKTPTFSGKLSRFGSEVLSWMASLKS